MDTQTVLADAGVVSQSGGAVVTGAGSDLCESVGHNAFGLAEINKGPKPQLIHKTLSDRFEIDGAHP